MLKQIRLRGQQGIAKMNIPGFSPEEIVDIAKMTGFQKRSPRKVTAPVFLCSLLEESVTGAPSYNDLAARIEVLTGISISKQGICRKVTPACVSFMQSTLAQAMVAKLPIPISSPSFGRYRRVLVQDSTVISLPHRLFPEFSGVSNGTSSVCNARIQVVVDLVSGEFIEFTIDPYSKNDLKSAPELELKKDDLILRDRGYLSGDEIQRHLDTGADCIFRHKNNFTYLDPKTKTPINLRSRLDRDGSIDIPVLLNNTAQTPIRLVAVPAPEEIASTRRMKLKKEGRGHKPSADLLYMASWTIFITTISSDQASFKELAQMYGLRWRIETIFKMWKSNMSFADIHNVSENQLQVLLTARLTMIVLFGHVIYRPAYARVKKDYGKELSMMKLTKYLIKNPTRIPGIIAALQEKNQSHIIAALARYCTYDKRKRLNFQQMLEEFLMGECLG
jgi:hypothetical protein